MNMAVYDRTAVLLPPGSRKTQAASYTCNSLYRLTVYFLLAEICAKTFSRLCSAFFASKPTLSHLCRVRIYQEEINLARRG